MCKIKMKIVGNGPQSNPVYVSNCGYVLSVEKSNEIKREDLRRWVLRKNGVYLDRSQYRDDLAEEYKLDLYWNN